MIRANWLGIRKLSDDLLWFMVRHDMMMFQMIQHEKREFLLHTTACLPTLCQKNNVNNNNYFNNNTRDI